MMSLAYKNGLSTEPHLIAELGPGDSFGVGLAALISGAKKYYAFDVVKRVDIKRNINVFDELLDLYKRREKVPDESEFPRVRPILESYEFPKHILSEDRLNRQMKEDRLESIRNSLLNFDTRSKNDIQISYYAPLYDSEIIKEGSIDMIISQAVLEHIDELALTYETLYRWLKPGGFMSHQIDFKCHGTARVWNGHWAYSDFIWRLISAKKSYPLNREPNSIHIDLLRKYNFELGCDIKEKDTSGIKRKHLASRFKDMSDDDLITCGAFIQVIKKNKDI